MAPTMRGPAQTNSPLYARAHELDAKLRGLGLRRRQDKAAMAKALLEIKRGGSGQTQGRSPSGDRPSLLGVAFPDRVARSGRRAEIWASGTGPDLRAARIRGL